MEIMNLCVLHLSDIERDTGSGVDREELIQWYLEQKETEFETEEDLEYERELIAKALTKLSRVCPFLPLIIFYHWLLYHNIDRCF
jgi:DNA replication licensing factor MCM6